MAVGDKVYIADKQTLDALNAKAGTTADTGGTASAGTLFGKLNAIISSIASHVANWTAARAANLDAAVSSRESEASAASRYTTLNTNTGVDNTPSATGTLSQKMSHLINAVAGGKPKYRRSRQSSLMVSNVGTYTFLNVTGPGAFRSLYGHIQYLSSLTIEIDGETFTYPMSISSAYMVLYMNIYGALEWNDIATANQRAQPMYFSKSFKITGTLTSGSATAFQCGYELFE